MYHVDRCLEKKVTNIMKIQVNKQNVGLRIKQLRQDKGYTLEAFGKLFDGATKGNVQQWEQGRSLPNKERIKAIAKLGDMTVNELLYGSEDNAILQLQESVRTLLDSGYTEEKIKEIIKEVNENDK